MSRSETSLLWSTNMKIAVIASTALANNLILVTHHLREFSRIEGLTIEDWEAE